MKMDKITVNISWSGENYCAGIEFMGVVAITHKSLEKLFEEIASAFEFHIEGCASDGDPVPAEVLAGNYKFEYNYEVSALIHRLDQASINAKLVIMHQDFITHVPNNDPRVVEGIHHIGQELMAVV